MRISPIQRGGGWGTRIVSSLALWAYSMYYSVTPIYNKKYLLSSLLLSTTNSTPIIIVLLL